MNLSMFEDWLYSVLNRTSEGTSYLENVGEGTKNDSSYRKNRSENETETPISMSVTTGRNISSRVKNLATSSTRETCRNISSKKNGDQGVNDLQNSRHESNLNTAQSWLHRFGKPEILPKLENSLELVKRNKIGQEDHEKLSKSIDKELQNLLLTFHPNRAGDTEWQAALNAIREVLKTLSEVFLENIFIDYKYEYFSRLDVRILVNENERNKIIQTIFYKISVFSETKRLNIVGEIHKFLTESEKCVQSFLEYRESDFLKFRDYALYHLRKNIEGYKKLEKEWNLLIEECRNEDDCIRTVVQNMVDHSSREYSILKELEQRAKSSFQGNFEIFPVQNDMDEYYILPFVDYVNVLSMCNLLLQPPKSLFFSSFSKVENFGTEHERGHFLENFILAYEMYQYEISNKKARQTLPIYKYFQLLRKTLKSIFRELQIEYKVEVYKESNGNRKDILDLKHFLENIEEKGKTFIEHLNQYKLEKKESSESVVNYRQDKKVSFEVRMAEEREIEELKKINLLPEREKSKSKMERNELPESAVNCWQNEKEIFKADMKNGEKESEGGSMKFSSTLEGEENQYKIKSKKSYESVLNCRLDEIKSLKVDMINSEKESEEDSIKFTSTLEGEENQCEMETKKSGESVLNCIQDEEKSSEKRDEDSRKHTSPLEGEENQNEMETKKFYELVLNCRQDE